MASQECPMRCPFYSTAMALDRLAQSTLGDKTDRSRYATAVYYAMEAREKKGCSHCVPLEELAELRKPKDLFTHPSSSHSIRE